jgi:hypothetical protein
LKNKNIRDERGGGLAFPFLNKFQFTYLNTVMGTKVLRALSGIELRSIHTSPPSSKFVQARVFVLQTAGSIVKKARKCNEVHHRTRFMRSEGEDIPVILQLFANISRWDKSMRNLRIEIAQVPDEQGSNETCPDASDKQTKGGRAIRMT